MTPLAIEIIPVLIGIVLLVIAVVGFVALRRTRPRRKTPSIEAPPREEPVPPREATAPPTAPPPAVEAPPAPPPVEIPATPEVCRA